MSEVARVAILWSCPIVFLPVLVFVVVAVPEWFRCVTCGGLEKKSGVLIHGVFNVSLPHVEQIDQIDRDVL